MNETWVGQRRVKYESEERDSGGVDYLNDIGSAKAQKLFDDAYKNKVTHFVDTYDRSYSLIFEYNDGEYYYIVMRGHDYQ